MKVDIARTGGFTIVELLVVIVVIAILASITVVAYSGIQKQTNTVAYTATADAVEKKIRIAMAQGLIESSQIPTQSFCFGGIEEYPSIPDFNEGVCYKAGVEGGPTVTYVVNETATQYLKTAGVDVSVGNLVTVKGHTVGGSEPMAIRGVIINRLGANLMVTWIPPDSSSCGRASNLIEDTIAAIKTDPTQLANAINQYGENWEAVIRDTFGGTGYCRLQIPFS